jgi:alkylhydroperoxidase family enzyme
MPLRRIPQRTSNDTTGDVQRLLAKLEAGGKDIRIIRMVANWAPGFRAFVLMSDALLFRGVLPPEAREVVVLYIAARLGNTYEWDEHVTMSEQAGVTNDQRRLILADPSAAMSDSAFPPHTQAAVRLADAVLTKSAALAPAWEQACHVLSDDGALEVIFAVAWWAGFVPTLTESLLTLEDTSAQPVVGEARSGP